MRLLFTSFNFFLTLVVASIAFVATTLEFPGIMNQLMEWAQQIPPMLTDLGVPVKYVVWVNILLTGEKLVLLGFVLTTRILFAVIGGALGPIFGFGERGGSGSAFDRWGRQ